MERKVKKNIVLVSALLLVLSTCGCTNPVNKILDNFKKPEPELVEIQNSDYSYTYRNSDGDIVFDKINKLNFVENLAVYNKDGKYGLVNKAGEIVVEPIYDFIEDFHDGMSAFFIQDISDYVKVGYFNNKGEVAIEPMPVAYTLQSCDTYDVNFYNGVALYRQPKTYKYGFIDKTGNFIIKPIYQWAEPFKGRLAPVTTGNKFGYIDITGKLVLPYKYVYADVFSEGLAAVYNGKTWGYIDETGNYAISSQFGSYEGHDGEEIANPFIDGYAAVFLGNGQAYRSDIYKGKFALIDKEGKIVDGKKYDSLWLTFDEAGKATYEASIGNKYYTLNSKGIVLKEE